MREILWPNKSNNKETDIQEDVEDDENPQKLQ